MAGSSAARAGWGRGGVRRPSPALAAALMTGRGGRRQAPGAGGVVQRVFIMLLMRASALALGWM
jgi:hypothetical protein